MKRTKLVLLLGLGLLGVSQWLKLAPQDAMLSANEAYREGNYTRAAEEYERAAQEGHDPSLASFNQGAALYRLQRFEDAGHRYDGSAARADALQKARAAYDCGNCALNEAQARGGPAGFGSAHPGNRALPGVSEAGVAAPRRGPAFHFCPAQPGAGEDPPRPQLEGRRRQDDEGAEKAPRRATKPASPVRQKRPRPIQAPSPSPANPHRSPRASRARASRARASRARASRARASRAGTTPRKVSSPREAAANNRLPRNPRRLRAEARAARGQVLPPVDRAVVVVRAAAPAARAAATKKRVVPRVAMVVAAPVVPAREKAPAVRAKVAIRPARGSLHPAYRAAARRPAENRAPANLRGGRPSAPTVRL